MWCWRPSALAVIGAALWVGAETERCRAPARVREARADHQLSRIGARSGDLSNRQLCRVRVGGRGRRQLRHLRPIDRWQLSAATHERCRGRPCTHVVARRSTDCVRPGPAEWTSERLSFCRRSAVPSSACSRPGRSVTAGAVGFGRVGSRGRRTASTWSSALGAPPDRTSAIYLYSFKDGKKRQLTRPPANLSDIHPVVSPDGRYLAFVRLNHAARGGNVFLQKLEQLQVVGEPTQLTFDRAVNAFDWTQDSRSVIHDAGPVEPGLWRIAVAGSASELVLPNIRAFRPSVARSGAGVVYQNMLDRFEHLGTARRRLPRIVNPQGTRHFASSRRRPATRTCNSHRMEHGSYSPLTGRATASCGCRIATDHG